MLCCFVKAIETDHKTMNSDKVSPEGKWTCSLSFRFQKEIKTQDANPVNCAAMNFGVHMFFWIGVSGLLGYNPSSAIAR